MYGGVHSVSLNVEQKKPLCSAAVDPVNWNICIKNPRERFLVLVSGFRFPKSIILIPNNRLLLLLLRIEGSNLEI